MYGEPGAAHRRPSERTLKLSISDDVTSVPTSFVPVELNRTSPSAEPDATVTVELLIGTRCPPKVSRKPA